MAERTDFTIDPLAYDFFRNESEIGGGIPIYRTDISLQGGLQFSPDYSPTFFGQTVAPFLSQQSPWGWIILLLAIIGLVTFFKKQ